VLCLKEIEMVLVENGFDLFKTNKE
jgi:hypothetical protein